MSRTIRIIGWGNVGRGDDGAALMLLDRLAEMGVEAYPDVTLHAHHQLGPEVAVDMADAEVVVFVDAHVDTERAALSFDVVQADTGGALDSHHCSPAMLLALCRSMGLRTPAAYVLAIRAYDCSFGDGLSRETGELVDRGVELLSQRLDSWRSHALVNGDAIVVGA